MQSITIAASFFLTGLVAPVVARDIQSRPFKLVLRNFYPELDGHVLAACHTGSSIQALYIIGKDGPGCVDVGIQETHIRFHLNVTQHSRSPIVGYEPAGKLVGNFPSQRGLKSEAMNFYYDPFSNVAHPLFEAAAAYQNSIFVTFGRDDNLMAVLSYMDGTVSPPTAGRFRAIQRWLVCTVGYTGYAHKSLGWVMGIGAPQNPTCVPTQIMRVFI